VRLWKKYRTPSTFVLFWKRRTNPAKPNAKAFWRSRIIEKRWSVSLITEIWFFLLGGLVSPILFAQEQTVTQQESPKAVPAIDCPKTFQETGQCPREQCKYGCFIPSEDGLGCYMACIDKPCLELKVAECPTHRCEIMTSCENQKVCYPKLKEKPAVCGSIGYMGQDVPCCEGLLKRCGVEFFDGSCDMYGRNSIHTVPTCIPCGNGICDQFENSCNCAEDCGRYGS